MASSIAARFHSAIKAQGGFQAVVRRYGIFGLADAALSEAWEYVGVRALDVAGRQPAKVYGWPEALLSPTCDYWLRYARVIHELDQLGPGCVKRVVEVASGGFGGIAWAMKGSPMEFCLVDQSPGLLRDSRGAKAERVCADACQLPFENNAFDVAVSLDTLEHLSQESRPQFLAELKRVASLAVILTCPAQSEDGLFRGRDTDIRLLETIEHRGGAPPQWLQEHLQCGHPTPEEILSSMPGAEIRAVENCVAWVQYAESRIGILGWITAGIAHRKALQRQEEPPPYRRAVVVWRKGPAELTGSCHFGAS